MADQTSVATRTESPDGFLADRQRFWDAFTRFTMFAVVAVAVVLILMAIFLL